MRRGVKGNRDSVDTDLVSGYHLLTGYNPLVTKSSLVRLVAGTSAENNMYVPTDRSRDSVSKTPLTKSFLTQKYVKERVSAEDIARLTGWSYSYVQRKINLSGVERFPQYEDITGCRSGKLVAVKFSHIDKRGAIWDCSCDCGKQKQVKCHLLKTQQIQSCGCNWRKAYYGISGSHFLNIKTHAQTRNLELSISPKEIWDLFIHQNKKCAISGIELVLDCSSSVEVTASLDRIDSSHGYVLTNVQWVHKRVNAMKSDMTQNEFIEWATKIHLFNNQKSSL